MSVVEVKIPQVGESITEGVLVEWAITDGDIARIDEPLLVFETDKITMTVAAEATGRLKTLVEADSEVEVGQVVATIDTAATADDEAPVKPAPPSEDDDRATHEAADLSPAVRRLVTEHGLDPAAIPGTGKDGRLLKADVLRHLEAGAAEAP